MVAHTTTGGTKWLQVGVASTSALDSSGAPVTAIFTRVSSFADWIETTTASVATIIPAADSDDDDDGGTTGTVTDNTNTEEALEKRLKAAEGEMLALQTTVRSLEGDMTKIKRLLTQLKEAHTKVKALQATKDGLLTSASTILSPK